MNEDYVVLDGQIEVENLDLSGELTSLYGWFATCSERPELDVWDYGFRQSVQLTSRPVGGFDSFFTSEFVIEPLTSTEIELPTIAYPAKDSLLPTECGDIEVAVFIYTLHRMLVVEALDLNGILRDLGPPPDQAWIGRDELCDALVAQDLQALYGYPITKWESADEIIGTPGAEGKLRNRFYFPSQCVFGTTSILVSNSASVQSGLRYDTAHRELRDVGDGVRLTASVDVLVESGNTLVYIQDDSNNGGLDADQLATLGRLISRLVDQIKD